MFEYRSAAGSGLGIIIFIHAYMDFDGALRIVQAYSLLILGALVPGVYPRLVGCRLTACFDGALKK